ncbi:uncharacterized protein Z519_03711 [Cladophialophora bantiana CBS 173.52]|uniref:Glutaredoxin-like protein n=1 Tax=Cladophialophora bantiana (strain ATCC 10958 / CBS 173.52 / CDC B-1940 / NIH 8579) TaxID=1442370 RepID=A0A0D2G953_CLAB1|nr:uncharacterized protein Z519_03711 [Cladophialophora bantiana CBS 173.52]KIW95127.1 hypothetical protein Z519_03711 [Cladophialophora bantiana CBS 173.52]
MRPSLALRFSLSANTRRAQFQIQLTLFTRANCGLCDVAKARVGEFTTANTKDKRQHQNPLKDNSKNEDREKDKQPAAATTATAAAAAAATPVVSYAYAEIDIMDPAQKRWRDVYEFDVPVLHIDPLPVRDTRTGAPSHDDYGDYVPTLDAAKKLMHRFTVEEVAKAVDEVVERGASL